MIIIIENCCTFNSSELPLFMPSNISVTYIDYIFSKSNLKQYVGKLRNAYKILVPKPDRKDYL
jgi:hypothetical protein